jgi:hypothetical protein
VLREFTRVRVHAHAQLYMCVRVVVEIFIPLRARIHVNRPQQAVAKEHDCLCFFDVRAEQPISFSL